MRLPGSVAEVQGSPRGPEIGAFFDLDGGLQRRTDQGRVRPDVVARCRIMGDDGIYVSARQICAETGIDLELLEAMHRALGLPHVDDLDGQVHLCADAEAAARARVFVDCWLPNRRAMQSAPPTALPAAGT
jgi:hypothetical protein